MFHSLARSRRSLTNSISQSSPKITSQTHPFAVRQRGRRWRLGQVEGHRVSPQAGGRGWTGLGLGGRGVDHRGAAPGWGRGCWCWRLLLAFRFLLSVLSVILEQTVAKAILSPEGKNICDTYRGLKSRRSRDCRRFFFDDEVCRSIFIYIYGQMFKYNPSSRDDDLCLVYPFGTTKRLKFE